MSTDLLNASAMPVLAIWVLLPPTLRAPASSVEPTRSQNITVSWRRSASSGRAAAAIGSVAAGTLPWSSPAMASRSLRRCPIEVMPSAVRSSAVSRGSTSASMSWAWNA
jgi:hypothetical protein